MTATEQLNAALRLIDRALGNLTDAEVEALEGDAWQAAQILRAALHAEGTLDSDLMDPELNEE